MQHRLAPTAARTQARLLVLGPAAAKVVALGSEPVRIGRGTGNTILVESLGASRHHCSIERRPDGRYQLRDLGSTNGCRLNARRISRAVLEDFDRLQVGDYVIVYLDGESDHDRIARVLGAEALALGASTSSYNVGRRGSHDGLLWLLLLLQELHSEVELVALLDVLLEELRRQLAQPWAALVLCEPEGGLRTVRAKGDVHSGVELTQCAPLVQRCLEEARVWRGRREGGQGVLAIPVANRAWGGVDRRRSQHGVVEGALLLGDPGPMPDACGRLLRAVGRQLAVHFAQAQLERQATMDPLTGLACRGFLEERAQRELQHAQQSGAPLSLVFLDVDDFKRVNDTHGHTVGDAVLRHLGRRLPELIRSTDVAGRWGGEEFLLLLPATDAEGARMVAEKVVAGLPEQAIPGTPGLRVTVSAGVATCPDHASELEVVIARADVALYRAKELGKDQVQVFGEDLESTVASPPDEFGRTVRLGPARRQAELERPAIWLHSRLLGAIPLDAGRIVIGRDASCGVVLTHPQVSRHHASLSVEEPDRVWFQDHSANGSWINGVRVTGSVALSIGDSLQIGPFDFVVGLEPASCQVGEGTSRTRVSAEEILASR